MDYNEDIENYQDDAEDRYDNYYEDEYEDDFDPGFEGREDEYYDDDYEEEEISYVGGYGDYEEDMDSYTKTSIGKIDPNDRTITVKVANTSGGDEVAILFGGNEEAAQAAGVVVDVSESSHKEVREESKANPFKIVGMKYSVSDALQFDEILDIVRRTAAGSNTTRVYQPRNATSPQNFTEKLIDDNNFEMDVTGQDSLRFIIKNGVTVTFTFSIKARANMGNLLRGNNVAELSRTPRTTGIPQFDIMQQKQKTAFGLKRPSKRKVVRRMVRKPARRRMMMPKGRARGRFLRRRR